MEKLTKKGNVITFRDVKLIYVSADKLDSNSVHLNCETQTNLFFADDTELNGIVYKNSDELIAALNK